MVESIECFQYGEHWKDNCLRPTCPTLFKVCFINDVNFLPLDYREKIRDRPFVVESERQVEYWKNAGFHPSVIYNPVGHWWFETEWNGNERKMLYVLAGRYKWRGDADSLGWKWWRKLEKRFWQEYYHHDPSELGAFTPLELRDMFQKCRVFVNLDWDSNRPLSTAFAEAMSAGLPVVARDCPSLEYSRFIDGNGMATNQFVPMTHFICICLQDKEYARRCGQKSREIARTVFATDVARVKMDALVSSF
jgi:hypothetical protein